MMPMPAKYYDTESSRVPDWIRCSFSDGTTEMYMRVVEQPAPVIYQPAQLGSTIVIGYAPGRMEKR